MVHQIESKLSLKQRKTEDFRKAQSIDALTSVHLKGDYLTSIFHVPIRNATETFAGHNPEAYLRKSEATQPLFIAHLTFR